MLRLDRLRPVVRLASEFSTTAAKRNDANDDGNKKKKAASKLQDLLVKLTAEDKSRQLESKVKIPRPVKRVVENRPVYKVKLDKIEDKHTVKLVAAVKDVADHVGGDVKATEAELLHVILNNKKPDLKVGGGDVTIENVISGMQVEKQETSSRAMQVRRSLPVQRPQRTAPKREKREQSNIDIFNQQPLGIFPKGYQAEPAASELTTWSRMSTREKRLLVTHPPSNIYEEMIRWTERGLLWTFPIDNEQGLEKEKNVDFTQHVFLDEHLEPWCPPKGPIRHFMELVIIGLSKNPYITVEAKIEHINWFRDYFDEKKKLLQDIGAVPVENKKTINPS